MLATVCSKWNINKASVLEPEKWSVPVSSLWKSTHLTQSCPIWNSGAGHWGLCLWDLNYCKVHPLNLFLKGRVKSSFLTMMWPQQRPCVCVFFFFFSAFSDYVIEYLRGICANELSTLKSKQTACLWFVLKSCLLTKQPATWFSKRRNLAGRLRRAILCRRREGGSCLFHLYYEDILCAIRTELINSACQ